MSTLTVKYYIPTPDVQLTGYTMRVEVTEAVDISNKIFVIHRDLSNIDEFNHVASPVDLEEFPEDTPDLENEMPYFRINTIDLSFRSYSELLDVKQLIDLDIKSLLKAVNIEVGLQTVEEVQYE